LQTSYRLNRDRLAAAFEAELTTIVVGPGLSVMGICTNKSCVAGRLENECVATTIGFGCRSMGDICEFESNCPECKKSYKPQTLVFFKCYYAVFGVKKDKDGKTESYNTEIRKAPDRDTYFSISIKPLNPNSSDIEKAIYANDHTWSMLKIIAADTEEEIKNDKIYKAFVLKYPS